MGTVTSKIKIVLGVVLVVLLVVIAVGVLSCGDDGDDGDDGPTSSARDGGGDDDGGDDESSDDPPPLRTVTSDRGDGQNATAAAGGIMDKPEQIWLRVSAAPKQQVKGSWNVSCGGGSTDLDAFEVTPPHLMRLRIPRKSPDSCVAGATAQLSGKGRLKIAILRDR